MDADGRPSGMFARTDMLRLMREAGQPLAEALTPGSWVTAFTDETAGSLADRMCETGAGTVPVPRRSDGLVVGVVARGDLLRVRSARQENEHEALIRLCAAPIPAFAPR